MNCTVNIFGDRDLPKGLWPTCWVLGLAGLGWLTNNGWELDSCSVYWDICLCCLSLVPTAWRVPREPLDVHPWQKREAPVSGKDGKRPASEWVHTAGDKGRKAKKCAHFSSSDLLVFGSQPCVTLCGVGSSPLSSSEEITVHTILEMCLLSDSGSSEVDNQDT